MQLCSSLSILWHCLSIPWFFFKESGVRDKCQLSQSSVSQVISGEISKISPEGNWWLGEKIASSPNNELFIDKLQLIPLKLFGSIHRQSFNAYELRTSQLLLVIKNLPANTGDIRETGSIPGAGNGNLLQYSCLEKLHGQRSLVGYSPQDHRVRHDWISLTHRYYELNLIIY